MSWKIEKYKIVVVGLGYVGLPVAMAFQKKYQTIGYDIDNRRIEELQNGFDRTNTFSHKEIKAAKASFVSELRKSDDQGNEVFLITVPTPIDAFKRPDLYYLFSACRAVAAVMKRGDVIIFESTVYPGCTEEECVPILEQESGLKLNSDFYVGYSPERINPGDQTRPFEQIIKLTSGSNAKAAEIVDSLYRSVVSVGTYQAPSIKVAEAAKLIENCQRDLNISFMNELAYVFDKMEISTSEVLAAASTKWNFLNFRPGLVGGHCISVDPYYMIHRAESLGYFPELIGAGRKINEQMPAFIAAKCIKQMIKRKLSVFGAKALILGITYKENCPDTRNSKIPQLKLELEEYGLEVEVYDPLADAIQVSQQYGIELTEKCDVSGYQLVILAVAHQKILERLKGHQNLDSQYFYDVRA